MEKPEYRIHEWIHTETAEIKYGVQAKPPYQPYWHHCMFNNEACIFDTKNEAKEFIAKLEEEDDGRKE